MKKRNRVRAVYAGFPLVPSQNATTDRPPFPSGKVKKIGGQNGVLTLAVRIREEERDVAIKVTEETWRWLSRATRRSSQVTTGSRRTNSKRARKCVY
jgi:hypothetical protein